MDKKVLTLDSLFKWLGENKGLVLICFALLLTKLVSAVLYQMSYDNVTNWLTEVSAERDYAKNALYGRESDPKEVLYAWGYRFDSTYYLRIAREGYSREVYFAFPPGFPLLIKTASWLGVGDVAAGVWISNLFHFISVILFYYVALIYIKKEQAVLATVLFTFFPYNMVSGTMAYSDMIFMAFSLLSWILLERRKYGWCGAAVFLASLMRFQGLLLYAIYSLMVLWRERNLSSGTMKTLVKLNITAVFFVYWFWIYIPSNEVEYSSIQEKYWSASLRYPLSSLVYILENRSTLGSILVFIAIISIAGLLAYQIKPELAAYRLIFILFYSSLWGTAAVSITRFLGTIWPAYIYMAWKLKKINQDYRLHVYLIAVFAATGICLLLLQMNWLFIC